MARTLPRICGSQGRVVQAMATDGPFYVRAGGDFDDVRSAFAIALHMHQPLIPTPAGPGQQGPAVTSNLQFMLDHPEVKDAHNAPAFLSCYSRMGRLIPQLLMEGLQPRVMLDYSGCLLHGLRPDGPRGRHRFAIPILNDLAALDGAVGSAKLHQVRAGGVIAEVSDVQLAAQTLCQKLWSGVRSRFGLYRASCTSCTPASSLPDRSFF
jgi:hypothetical protein